MLPFPHIIRMFYNHQKWQLPVTQGKLHTTNGQPYICHWICETCFVHTFVHI